jgi:hypothetical protein
LRMINFTKVENSVFRINRSTWIRYGTALQRAVNENCLIDDEVLICGELGLVIFTLGWKTNRKCCLRE